MNACRSCGAEIVWARTQSGRAMPLDARPESRVVVEGGIGRVVPAYVPHWATCPQAAEHRRAKEGTGR